MTTSLVVRREITSQVWSMIQAIAPSMHKSRLFGVSSPEQATAIMLKGYELGLGLTASFEFIQVIQGQPTLAPRGALALLHGHPECVEITIEDKADDKGNPLSCRVSMKRRNGFEYAAEFSMADAKAAGLIKSGSGWEKYPRQMLKWRAVGFAADVVFPDVIGGMRRADELGALVDESGDVIEGEWVTPAIGGISSPTLDDLVQEYGAEAVLEAAGGTLPDTAEQLAEVAAVLNGEPENAA